MGFKNEDGTEICMECTELINELKQDIQEFGGNEVVYVWCKRAYGVVLYVNYDFITEDDPVSINELEEGEYLQKMTMTALLMLLEQQNAYSIGEDMSIRSLRQMQNLSMQDVADIFDIPVRNIERWEGGQRKAPEYIEKRIKDDLIRMSKEELENRKKYIVLEYEKGCDEKIVCEGSKYVCSKFEEQRRAELTQEERLTHDFITKKYAEYKEEKKYFEEYKKYISTLTKQELHEKIQIGDKMYAKHVLDFRKKFYNKQKG